MILVKLLIIYYFLSLLSVWGILWLMRSIYKIEGVSTPWWPYTKLALIPIVGGLFVWIVIYYDFKHHVVNQERRNRAKHLENGGK